MAVDFTAELFAIDLFRHLWHENHVTNQVKPRPPAYENKGTAFFDEYICKAVRFRQLIYRDAMRLMLLVDYGAVIAYSTLDFYYYFSNFCSRFAGAEISVFDEVLCTCAVIAEIAMYALDYNSEFLEVVPWCWAMYFDLKIKIPFYTEGGWKKLQRLARSYLKSYEFVIKNGFTDDTLKPNVILEMKKIHKNLPKYLEFITEEEKGSKFEKEFFRKYRHAKKMLRDQLNLHGQNMKIYDYSVTPQKLVNLEGIVSGLKYVCDPHEVIVISYDIDCKNKQNTVIQNQSESLEDIDKEIARRMKTIFNSSWIDMSNFFEETRKHMATTKRVTNLESYMESQSVSPKNKQQTYSPRNKSKKLSTSPQEKPKLAMNQNEPKLPVGTPKSKSQKISDSHNNELHQSTDFTGSASKLSHNPTTKLPMTSNLKNKLQTMTYHPKKIQSLLIGENIDAKHGTESLIIKDQSFYSIGETSAQTEGTGLFLFGNSSKEKTESLLIGEHSMLPIKTDCRSTAEISTTKDSEFLIESTTATEGSMMILFNEPITSIKELSIREQTSIAEKTESFTSDELPVSKKGTDLISTKGLFSTEKDTKSEKSDSSDTLVESDSGHLTQMAISSLDVEYSSDETEAESNKMQSSDISEEIRVGDAYSMFTAKSTPSIVSPSLNPLLSPISTVKSLLSPISTESQIEISDSSIPSSSQPSTSSFKDPISVVPDWNVATTLISLSLTSDLPSTSSSSIKDCVMLIAESQPAKSLTVSELNDPIPVDKIPKKSSPSVGNENTGIQANTIYFPCAVSDEIAAIITKRQILQLKLNPKYGFSWTHAPLQDLPDDLSQNPGHGDIFPESSQNSQKKDKNES